MSSPATKCVASSALQRRACCGSQLRERDKNIVSDSGSRNCCTLHIFSPLTRYRDCSIKCTDNLSSSTPRLLRLRTLPSREPCCCHHWTAQPAIDSRPYFSLLLLTRTWSIAPPSLQPILPPTSNLSNPTPPVGSPFFWELSFCITPFCSRIRVVKAQEATGARNRLIEHPYTSPRSAGA
ncbi:hypothetical protein EJ06DRAFT_251108 [Trichodelitschia bisporula]|uniref:Uncharacterized protein n=1 Tax=Trichodelitschia bisporula TaxID=703511 RepID=A0A6G1HIY1_9PEZI|nr:hypothetical protein EJ06DRAFT_251108 [Trichodelitschia bisporula]